MSHVSVTKDISAQNIYSDWLYIQGYFNLSIYGTWVATVTVQRSFNGGSTQLDVEAFAANVERAGFESEGAYYRIGVKTGDYTSGTASIRLAQITAGSSSAITQ